MTFETHPSARSVPRAAFELRQPADVILVEMGQHRSSHIGEVVPMASSRAVSVSPGPMSNCTMPSRCSMT